MSRRSVIIAVAVILVVALAAGVGAWFATRKAIGQSVIPGKGDTLAGCQTAIAAQWAKNIASDAPAEGVDRQTQDFFPACDDLSEADYATAMQEATGFSLPPQSEP